MTLLFPASCRPVAAVLAALVASATAQADLDVLSVLRHPDGVTDVTVTSQSVSYYILWRSDDTAFGPFAAPEDVKLGSGGPLLLSSEENTGSRGFYKVEEVARAASRDLDQDGIPDVFELTYPGCLDPLNPGDWAADCDNDGLSNLQEFSDGTDPTHPDILPEVVINEVDYDSVGADTAEFVEILNPTGVSVSLNGLALVFVNGADNLEYLRVDLTPAGSLGPGEYLVGGSISLLSTVPATAKKLAFADAQNSIQNGAPDGVAIIRVATSTVIDALSYEGGISAAVITGFPGTVSLIENTMLPSSVADTNTVAHSLCRLPNGLDTNDASHDWSLSNDPTPGSANVP